MIAALAAVSIIQATQDTSRHLAWSGFVDTYYAYDAARNNFVIVTSLALTLQ